jgi:hypothetical protein
MIASIVVGSGSGRTVIERPRNRDTSRELANKIKGFLFPNSGQYHKAKRRGAAALDGGC